MKRITLSQILVFFLLSSAVDAQSSSRSAASPNAPLPVWDVSFAPVIVAVLCAFFFTGCFAIFLHHCSDMELPVGDPTGATGNCSSSGPQGLDPKLLDTFPILVYSAVKNLKSGKSAAALECAVCLSEFDHHDTLRLLPKCNHVFHPQCIDAWFASHETCPVCRARLKSAEERRQGENEVVIEIPNEVNTHQGFDESSQNSRTELHLGDRTSLGRCRSTGHSLGMGEIRGKKTFGDNVRPSEDVRKQIPVTTQGGMRRSASCDVFGGQPGDQAESSKENLIL